MLATPVMPAFRRRLLSAALVALLPAIAAARAGPPPAAPAPAPELRLLLAGQALVKHDLPREVPARLPAIRELLRAGDPHVIFTNLETAILGDFGGANTRNTEFFHATGAWAVDYLKDFGFNLFATGNNHSWDLGAAGVLSTLAALDQRGLVHAGSGRNLGEASAPAFLSTPAGRVALVGFASGKVRDGGALAMRPGVNEVRLDAEKRLVAEDVARVLAAIRLAREYAPHVIVYQHDHYWEEDRGLTPDWKKAFARACLDAGGTIFVSHGVPQLHGLEIYRGRPIFYGLGSFIFHSITKPGFYRPEVWQTVLADLVVRGDRLVSVRIRPLLLNELGFNPARHNETRGLPTTATGADARRVLDTFARQSAEFGTTLRYEGDAAYVDLTPTPSAPVKP